MICLKCREREADRKIGGVPVCRECWRAYPVGKLLAASQPGDPDRLAWLESYRLTHPRDGHVAGVAPRRGNP